MRHLIACLAALMCLTFTSAAAAQDATDPALQRREGLVRQYLESIEFDKLMDAQMSALTAVMTENMAETTSLPAETRDVIADVTVEVMGDMRDRIVDRYVALYARTLTEEELEAMVHFYRSDLGRSIMSKTRLIASEGAEIVGDFMPEIRETMRTRMCSRIKCPSTDGANEAKDGPTRGSDLS